MRYVKISLALACGVCLVSCGGPVSWIAGSMWIGIGLALSAQFIADVYAEQCK